MFLQNILWKVEYQRNVRCVSCVWSNHIWILIVCKEWIIQHTFGRFWSGLTGLASGFGQVWQVYRRVLDRFGRFTVRFWTGLSGLTSGFGQVWQVLCQVLDRFPRFTVWFRTGLAGLQSGLAGLASGFGQVWQVLVRFDRFGVWFWTGLVSGFGQVDRFLSGLAGPTPGSTGCTFQRGLYYGRTQCNFL